MAPTILVRPKPLRPTAPPSPRAPSSLNSGRHAPASCPPTNEDSPPSRALTRNPFHRHAATAAAFLPSHTPGALPPNPTTFPSFGAATMPVTPITGGALRMTMGEGASEDEGARRVSELAPALVKKAVRDDGGVEQKAGDEAVGGLDEAAAPRRKNDEGKLSAEASA
ncbi:hypothetical protein BCR35DRAFT_209583 [Leucosporidium creatinivorum]|uniref:Uncharacterized protein n=1 Tax=Leucosporidium creatinivorum TaxID=106004 RepID=A0A1Y2DEH7_9BASI|nr:hypothetical protein BCR35DRAFT_209583 [Leucosporidium creatinivorum]